MPAEMPTGDRRLGDSMVFIHDKVNGHAIDFERMIDVPAGRVQPGDEYATRQKFIRDADAAILTRDVRLGKGRDQAAGRRAPAAPLRKPAARPRCARPHLGGHF